MAVGALAVGRMGIVAFALVGLLCCWTVEGNLNDLFNNHYSVDGTWYQRDNVWDGACQIATNDMNLQTVAIGNNLWMNSLPCGTCLQVNASGKGAGRDPIQGYFKVLVTDRCPECGNGLDFGETTQLDGSWDIDWIAVACPVAGLTFKYQFQGSNDDYLKFSIMNTLMPVSAVSVNNSGNMVDAYHSEDGWWIAEGTKFTFNPLVLVITSINGEVVTERLPITSAPPNESGQPNGFSAVQVGSAQFTDGDTPPPGSAGALSSWLSFLLHGFM